jgi:hypothetical protein
VQISVHLGSAFPILSFALSLPQRGIKSIGRTSPF